VIVGPCSNVVKVAADFADAVSGHQFGSVQ
jgi:hypothetical protein